MISISKRFASKIKLLVNEKMKIGVNTMKKDVKRSRIHVFNGYGIKRCKNDSSKVQHQRKRQRLFYAQAHSKDTQNCELILEMLKLTKGHSSVY